MTTIAKKVMWIGRATVFSVGLIVTLAIVLGVGTTALAAVPGDPFKLGKTNTIDHMSTLVGSASGALLKINNNGSGPALDLLVEEGEAPMTVDSTIQVDDFNADQVDGKSASAFISEDKIYTVTEREIGVGGGAVVTAFADCDSGDIVLGGGGGAPGAPSLSDLPSVSEPNGQGWRVTLQDNGDGSTVEAKAICADFLPLRP